jgi:NADP-dependent 3-hydroxy acid dehydrogenase YdfG
MTKPVVVVTGASQGIGAAIARVFASEIAGVRLALVARSAAPLKAVARACAALGADARAFPCDVSDEAAVNAMAADVQRVWRKADVLVNNAGSFRAAPFLETSAADFDRMISVNLKSVFLVSKAFCPAMVKAGRGDVFNMSSIAGLAAYPGGSGYCSAKFGVSGLSKVMRAEFKGKGVRVCCVYPGATHSPAWRGSGVPAGRMMPAADVARAFFEIYRMSRRTVVEEIVMRPIGRDLP